MRIFTSPPYMTSAERGGGGGVSYFSPQELQDMLKESDDGDYVLMSP